MPRFTARREYEQTRKRIKLSYNPCPGRSCAEREYITRRLHEVATLWANQLAVFYEDGAMPEWLPMNEITPSVDTQSVDNRDYYINAPVDEYDYLIDDHNHNQRATNTITVAACWRTPDDSYRERFLSQKIIVSPFLCPTWGALPLTLAQWRVITPTSIRVHMQWSWVHAVRKYMDRADYMPDGILGWSMNRCKHLPQSNYEGPAEWSYGRDIYKQVSERLSSHLMSQGEVIKCPS